MFLNENGWMPGTATSLGGWQAQASTPSIQITIRDMFCPIVCGERIRTLREYRRECTSDLPHYAATQWERPAPSMTVQMGIGPN